MLAFDSRYQVNMQEQRHSQEFLTYCVYCGSFWVN